MKDLLVGGELNILFCPECSHTFFYEHFLLYLDPELNIAAYVYPPHEEEAKQDLEEMMKRGFADAQEAFDPKDRMKCDPELLFGLDELQRRIREADERHLSREVENARQDPQ